MSSKSSCTCSNKSPYVNPSDKWSLQNAIRYTINRFLDKSSTKKNWSIMLDPNYSPLSSYERRKRINYAIYDCFAVTLLHQAVCDKWSLTQLREAELISLFTLDAPPHSSSTLLENISEDENETESTSLPISNAPLHSSSLRLSTLLEDVSEDESKENDEIFISFLSSQRGPETPANTIENVETHHATIPGDDIIDSISLHPQLSFNEPPRPRRTCRSAAARTRRNRKHNKVLRLYRDQHIIYRKVYHRFNLRQIKNILRTRDVRYVHPKLDKSSRILSIGMKKSSLVDLYFGRIPGDLFDKFHYQQYRRQGH
ncbi:unnamed protein product [Rotaria sordida]|uniref:Uncharacterized protein n=2 Tax=Rotaria sordida TaxID=392033 RepID=A0A815KY10_9BILA|nr:unnamed protein product [Rotaria sordida]CAF1480896.1 unnamed protein product [Rotaria sordida]CAF3916443.1 unnamed protein product [Rotaria sordida]